MKKPVLLALLMIVAFSYSAFAADLTSTIYGRLLEDHSPTFEAAKWVVAQSKSQSAEVIAILRKMLFEPATVEAFMKGTEFRRADGSTLTNMYPNNVIWALAHIPDESVQGMLKDFFQRDMVNGVNRVAGAACFANEVRIREGSEYSILMEDFELLKAPASAEYTPVYAGDIVKILGTDAKGFYYVQVMPVGLRPKGYLAPASPLI